MKCPKCGQGKLHDWISPMEWEDYSEKPVMRAIWECDKCETFFLMVWIIDNITELKRDKIHKKEKL